MSATRADLRLAPERCDRCGRCVGRCKPRAIKLGPGYIYIDSALCDNCLACADVCDRGAITKRDRTSQSAPVARPKSGAAAPAARPTRPRPALQPTPWTAPDAFLTLVVLLGCLIAVNFALGTEVVRLMPASGKVLARVAGLALTYGVVFALLFVLAARHKTPFARAFCLVPVAYSWSSALGSAGLVLALLVGTRVVATAYSLVTQKFSWEPSVNWNSDLTQVFGPGATGFALTVALAVFFGPFVEELVFRGVVLSALGERWSATGAVLICSALFAVYHFSLWMFVPILVLGMALGWITQRTEGLWPAISLHVLYNAVTVAAAFWVIWG